MKPEKAKKTKVVKRPDGKIELTKVDGISLASLVGKKPENVAKVPSDLGALLKALCEENGWIDDKGVIA
jgi:hypothetical protein